MGYQTHYICRSCNILKPRESFSNNKKHKSGKDTRCKDCRRERTLSAYGITHYDYNKLLENQNNCCAICKKEVEGNLVVDHCHVTGLVRGLLCNQCNTGIGLLGDNYSSVKKASNYLKKFESTLL